jgi:enamine deaminase RidA (YjgF/YER057c/UK114 family)
MSKRQAINPWGEAFKGLTFAPAVRRGNMLFISGTDATMLDENGRRVIRGGFIEQYRTIFEKFKMILDEAGATFDDIVWTCEYITTKEGYKATAQVRREIFGDNFPASTGIVVKDLLSRDALIEMDAVVILDK